MKAIPLTQSKVAIINNADFALVSRFKWFASKGGNIWYARTNVKTKAGRRPVSMHRMIMGFPKAHIDHRNLDGLDNRRRNLRLATKGQNAANSPGHRDRKSRHKGVCFEKFTGRWLAQLTVNGKRVFKARFATQAQAARAYKANARIYFGKYAYIDQWT